MFNPKYFEIIQNMRSVRFYRFLSRICIIFEEEKQKFLDKLERITKCRQKLGEEWAGGYIGQLNVSYLIDKYSYKINLYYILPLLLVLNSYYYYYYNLLYFIIVSLLFYYYYYCINYYSHQLLVMLLYYYIIFIFINYR